MKKKFYSRSEAAELFGVCEMTISHWVRDGVLVNVGGGHGPLRITAKSVNALLDKYADIVQEENAIEKYRLRIEQKRKQLEADEQKLDNMLCGCSLRTYMYENAPMLNKTMATALRYLFEKSELTNREYEILKAMCEGGNIDDSAELYGLTRERTRQISEKALRRLRIYLSKVTNQEQEVLRLREEVGKLSTANRDLVCKADLLKKENDQLRESLNIKLRDETESIRVPKYMMKPLGELELSARLMNVLKAMGVKYLFQVSVMSKLELLKFRNFGKKSLTELDDIFEAHGVEFGCQDVRESCIKVIHGIAYEDISVDRLKHDRCALLEEIGGIKRRRW